MPGTAATAPQRPPRTSFYVTVGCLSVIAGLVLGVGGFFGVRALQDGAATLGGESQESTPESPTPEAEPTVLDETPVGSGAAVPFGSTFPIRSGVLDGDVELTLTDVDWDATPEILEANSFTEEPTEGNTYILLSMEGVYRGEDAVDMVGSNWIGSTYVAEDGTRYSRVYRVTPRYDEVVSQGSVSNGDTFIAEYPFEIPEGIEGGGHFVFSDDGQTSGEKGAWVEAS